MNLSTSRWPRIFLAATRLAALYAAGVLVLVIPLMLIAGGFGILRDILTVSPLVAAICFVLGFVLLALARRVGFAILWLLVLGLWVNVLREGLYPFLIVTAFPGWTAFAAPLYVMTAVGLGRPSDAPPPPRWRWLRFEVPVTLVVWLVATAGALLLSPPPPVDVLELRGGSAAWTDFAGYAYALFPLLIGARELIRIVLAVRGPSSPRSPMEP